MRVSKTDWELFIEKLPSWQESYMDKLISEYIDLLKANALPSERFHELDKRINQDKKKKGVRIRMNRENVITDIASLMHDQAITLDDLQGFSSELKDAVLTVLDIIS